MFLSSTVKQLKNELILIQLPRWVVLLFVILMMIAMMVYPGGQIHNDASIGYSFTNNFFSDLGTHTSYNGSPNFLSMGLFMIALTLVGITFSIYYVTLPQLFSNDTLNYRLATLGSFFGFLGSVCLIGTGFTPADLVLDEHVFFANNIFYSFCVTALCYTVAIFRSSQFDNQMALGYGIFFMLIVLYIGVLEFGDSPRSNPTALKIQVVTQKIIVFVFCLSIAHQTIGLKRSNQV